MTALFWLLEPATQAALMSFQWQNYGEKLKVVQPPQVMVSVNAQAEPLDEIERIMKKAPKSPRHVT